jgi:hypothetical protein
MAKAASGITSLGTVCTFLKVGTCSEALCNVLDRAFDHPLKLEEHAAMPFAGGIIKHGYQCGLIWGATLAAGAQAYQLLGPGPQAEAQALIASQRLVESFQARYGDINCLELTETDWRKSMKVLRYFIKGGTFKCFGMAARFAKIAFTEISSALPEKMSEAPPSPVSCAAMLARKMGASDLHTVMAAGFAGGIGLSGGACGGLGAAIWIFGLNSAKGGTGKLRYDDPKAMGLIEKFLKSADYKFECSEIVGRKFENIDDHAGYMREGGCSRIIETLATP